MRRFFVMSALILFVATALGAAAPSSTTSTPSIVAQPGGVAVAPAPSFPLAQEKVTGVLADFEQKPPAAVTPSQPIDPGQDFLSFVRLCFNAAKNGEWKLVPILLIIGIVWALRKWGAMIPVIGSWLTTDRGGAILALLAGVFGVIGAGLISGASWSFTLIRDGILLGVTAAGGWSVLKKILGPDIWEAATTGTTKEEIK